MVFLAAVSCLEAAGPVCPPSIGVTESLTQRYPGWTEGRATEPRRLSGMTVFEGDPKEQASLVGEERKVSKTVSTATWTFTPGGKYFVSCSYSGTRAVLSSAIPQSLKSLTITYGTDVTIDGLPEIRKVAWK